MVSEIKRLLKARDAKKAKFARQCLQTKVTLKDTWRRPRGLHSKQRKDYIAKGEHPEAGFGSPRAVRGFHPSGYREVLIFTIAELESIDPATTAVRIGASVGNAKRFQIQDKAKELGIKVLNVKAAKAVQPKVAEADTKAIEEPKAEEPVEAETKAEEKPKAKKAAKKAAEKKPAAKKTAEKKTESKPKAKKTEVKSNE
ncbi:MAG: 50S ribosomal protein L32e [Methanocorpusculum sp.]|nr:50S ribosomal protein L32e [Methanocorpusculum sp.]